MAFKMKGVKHFTKDKEEWKGATHKMDDGSAHTGKTHNEDSEELFHEGDSGLKKRGLWDNIHAKRKRGDTSTDDRPSAEEWKKNTN